MSDNTCPCPKPATTTLIPVRGLSFSVSKDLFKDYPTRNEVVERIEDAKTELEEKITETKNGLEEKIQDTKDELDGKINDTRNDLEDKIRDAAEEADAKFVPQTRSVNTTAPLTGGGKLDHDLTLAIDPALLDSLATKDGVAEKIQEAKEAVEETLRETKDGLEEKIQDTKGELENTIRETADTLVPKTRVINTTGPLTGGGALDHDLTLDITPGAEGSVLVSRGGKAVWEKQAPSYELCEFYFFRHPTLRAGFQLAQGGLLADAATLYPEAWAYLQTPEGQKLCKTEAEWLAMTTATWATLADGTKVGWNGIGGAPFYAPNTATGALRLPDLRGMYAEAAGFDGLGVGGVHGDAVRRIQGVFNLAGSNDAWYLSAIHSPSTGGICGPNWQGSGQTIESGVRSSNHPTGVLFDSGRTTPYAAKNQPRAWGALACVYLGLPAA